MMCKEIRAYLLLTPPMVAAAFSPITSSKDEDSIAESRLNTITSSTLGHLSEDPV